MEVVGVTGVVPEAHCSSFPFRACPRLVAPVDLAQEGRALRQFGADEEAVGREAVGVLWEGDGLDDPAQEEASVRELALLAAMLRDQGSNLRFESSRRKGDPGPGVTGPLSPPSRTPSSL